MSASGLLSARSSDFSGATIRSGAVRGSADGSGSSSGVTMRSGSVGGSASARVCASSSPRASTDLGGQDPRRQGRVRRRRWGAGRLQRDDRRQHPRCVDRCLLRGADRLGRNDRDRQGRGVHDRALGPGHDPAGGLRGSTGRRTGRAASVAPCTAEVVTAAASCTADTAFPVAACANEPGAAGGPPLTTGSVDFPGQRGQQRVRKVENRPRSAQRRRDGRPGHRQDGLDRRLRCGDDRADGRRSGVHQGAHRCHALQDGCRWSCPRAPRPGPRPRRRRSRAG